MKKIIRLFCVILAIFTIFMLSSCADVENSDGLIFVLDRTNMNMSIGDVYTVSWAVVPTPEEQTAVSWRSSDEAVVTCEGGVVRAVGEGRAIVTATHSTGAYDVITITVKDNNRKLYMLEGETIQLKGEDINIALKGAECVSSDTAVATAMRNESGALITAIAKGTSDIKLVTENASIIYYDLIVLSSENSGVNVDVGEFPLVVNYDSGRYQSAVEITNISVEKRDTREFLNEETATIL